MQPDTLRVPIFPLPETVFFPNTVLYLHVFEPRYKQLIADALSGEGLIGVVQLRPGWDSDYYGTPPVYKVLGVGRIAHSELLPDGRYNVTLHGEHRVQIVSESMCGEYRVAQCEILKEYVREENREQVQRLSESLHKVMEKFLAVLPQANDHIKPGAWPDPSPGVLADLLAHLFMEDPYEKQCILSELDVWRRLQLVEVQVQQMLRRE